MKPSLINDLGDHHRDKVFQQIADLIDTCCRIADNEDEARAASAFIVIRVAVITAASAVMENGGSEEHFLEICSGYWKMLKREFKEESASG